MNPKYFCVSDVLDYLETDVSLALDLVGVSWGDSRPTNALRMEVESPLMQMQKERPYTSLGTPGPGLYIQHHAKACSFVCTHTSCGLCLPFVVWSLFQASVSFDLQVNYELAETPLLSENFSNGGTADFHTVSPGSVPKWSLVGCKNGSLPCNFVIRVLTCFAARLVSMLIMI